MKILLSISVKIKKILSVRVYELCLFLIVSFFIAFIAYSPMSWGRVAAPLQILPSFFSWNKVQDNAVKNDLISDVVVQIIPYRVFTLDNFKQRHLPLWNDQILMGEPFLANVQSAIYNPVNIIASWLDLDVLSLHNAIIFLQLVGLLFFSYIMLREFDVSAWGAAVGASAFAFSGYITVWAEWGTIGTVISWLPLVLAVMHYWFRTGKRFLLGGISLSFGAHFYMGHFQFSLFICMTAVLYLIIWQLQNLKLWRTGAVTAVALFIGLLLAGPQIIPAVVESQKGFRVAQSTNTSYKDQVFAKPIQTVVQLFSPTVYGSPIQPPYKGNINFNEDSSWIGLIAICLAMFGLKKGKESHLLFLMIAFFGFVFSTGVFDIYYPIWKIITPLQALPSLRFLVCFSFGLCMLAGFGTDNIIGWVKTEKIFISNKVIVLIGGGILTSSILLGLKCVAHNGFHSAAILSIYHYVWPIFIVVWISLLIALMARNYRIIALVLVLAVLVEGIRFSNYYLPFSSRENIALGNPAFNYIKNKDPQNDYRIITANSLDVNMYYGIAQPLGYDSLYPMSTFTFINALSPIGLGSKNPLMFRSGLPSANQLSALGVRYIISNSHTENIVGYHLIKSFSSQDIYESNVLVSTSYFSRFIENGDIQKQLQKISDKDFPVGDIITDSPKVLSKAAESSAVRISNLSGDYKYSLSTSVGNYFLFGQSFNNDWHAFLDGNPIHLARANYNLGTVYIPEGKHILQIYYLPKYINYSLCVFLIGIILAVFMSFPLFRRKHLG